MAIKRCREPFACMVGGVPRAYTAGQLVDDSDPAYKGREHLFEDVEAGVIRRGGVEQATAAPGEKRTMPRPGRRGAGRKAEPKQAEPKQAEAHDADKKAEDES